MVDKIDQQTFMNEFHSPWVLNSFGLVSYLSKKISILQHEVKKHRSFLQLFEVDTQAKNMCEIHVNLKWSIQSSCNK